MIEIYLFILDIIGTIAFTGVGGGILRDLFSNKTPDIFVKKIYACATIIGALMTALLFSVNNALRLSPTIMKGGGHLNEPPCYEDELVLFFSTIIISNNIEHGFNMS